MEWKTVKLGDVCDLIAGFAFKAGDFGDYPQKVVKIGDINPPHVTYASMSGIDLSKYDVKKLEKVKVQYGDYVLAMTGATIGKVGKYIDSTFAYLNQRVLKFKPKPEVHAQFVNYVVYSAYFRQYVMNHIDSESAQPNISATTIGKYEFLLPSLDEQHRIAAILSSLDDKIENNNRINRNLEEQAQALFKSWFVDFEPWGGIMPDDWKVGTLGVICKQLKERVGERDDVKVLSPVTTGKLVLSEEYFTKQVFSQSIAKYIIVPPTSFAYNPARVNIGSLGMNEYDLDGCVSPVYVVFECLDGYEYYFDLFRQTNMFKEEVKLRAIGGVRQSLNYEDFARITCNIPSKDAIEKFNTIYLANLNVRNHNSKENDRLAALRDTLLPKLMKGEILL